MLVFLALLSVVVDAVQVITGVDGPGFRTGSDLQTVIAVIPASSAQRAGMRPGDRIVGSQIPSRHFRVWYEHPGGPVQTAELTPACCDAQPNVTVFGFVDALSIIIGVGGSILLAAWLFWARPGAMTLGLLLGMLTIVAYPARIPALAEPFNRALHAVTAFATYNGFCGGFALFALRFPADDAIGWRRWVQVFVVAAIVVSQGALTAGMIATLPKGITFGSATLYTAYFDASLYAGLAWTVVAAVVLAARYAGADPTTRVKIRWAIVGFTVALAVTALSFIEPFIATMGLGWFDPIANLAALVLPGSAVYAMLRTRAIDPSFVINRAAVLGVAGAGIAGIVGAVDWLTEQAISTSRASLVVSACVSILLGYALSTLRGNLERAIERVLFRRRYAAAEYIRRLGRSLLVANHASVVERALVDDAASAMSLASAALFSLDYDSGTFFRGASFGWSTADVVQMSPDDVLVRFLRSEQQAVNATDARWQCADIPSGAGRPILAVPLLSSYEMVAFVLYGAHTNRSGIDIDERQTLAQLCECGANALEHIKMLELRRQLALLRADALP
jgi:hypothetical protein